MFDPSIFKAYDIRGIYGKNLDEDIAERIGRAYVKLLRPEVKHDQLTLVVARDMRLSSPQLSQSLISGLRQAGANVIDIGLSSTPMFYFAVSYLKADGGIQVSASHNPPEYNGFKLVRQQGIPVSGESGIYQIRDWVEQNQWSDADQPGQLKQQDSLLDEYVRQELAAWNVQPDKLKHYKIVIDAANAMGSLDARAIFQQLPGEVVELNFELDGSFPAHPADPLKPENLVQLQEAVQQQQADLGIAIDGDGDRYFFVDERGQVIDPAIVRGVLAQRVLARYPGSTICYDIRPGKITKDLIEQAGGQPSLTKVGHSLIKEQMLKLSAPFGGESSGHFFFKFDFGTFEAPPVTIGLMLEFFSQDDLPVSDKIKPYQTYFHSGEINSTVSDPQAKIAEIESRYADGEINKLDGITVTYPDWWFNVRPSNTEPKLRLNLEAVSQQLMEQKRDEVLALIRS